ncbi:MAG: cardiolipin synthase [Thiohalobacteraceae bacterium]
MTILLVILGAILVTVIVLNLGSGEKKIEARIASLYAVGDQQFHRSMGSLLGPPLLQGNRITALQNGDEIFPAMLDAIRGARETINFETYIYWSGEIGTEFADTLSQRARDGIRVNVLVDWAGSVKMEESLLDEMREAGVEVRRFHPVRWYTLSKLNNRTHRKLLVVDGRVGFTGGVGIADLWQGHAQDESHWRDSHFRLEGPAVAQMQAAFLDNWIKTDGAVLHGPDYFPELKPMGESWAQVFRSAQDEGAESVRLMYLLSVACARQRIDIASAYFVPDDLSLDMLVAALKRGVRVRILVPGRHTDSPMVRRASRARWGRALEAGAEIYEFQPTMFHCKVMMVDALWSSVGSTNFDTRSFRLNAEANLNVLDAEFATAQTEVFESDLQRARQITYEDWRRRPWNEKLKEHLAQLLRSQL